MGTYPIICEKCGKPFVWFSGNAPWCAVCLRGDD